MTNIDQIITAASQRAETQAWQAVPGMVANRYKQASRIERDIKKMIKHLPAADPGYGYVFWNPRTKTVFVVLGDSDEEQTHQKWHNALKAIPGVQHVESEAEAHPPNIDDWVRIKAAAAFSWLNAPYEMAGKPFGGPSAMSNSIVSGLIGGGLGYGTGTLIEKLFPERYVERGKLRKNLAALGVGTGAALHVPQAMANASLNTHATGEPHWLRSSLLGDAHQQVSPNENAWRDHQLNLKQGEFAEPPQFLLDAADKFVKQAFMSSGIMGSQVPLRAIPVDAFNQAIWNDVHNGANSSQSNPYGTRNPQGDNSGPMHTPPAHAAAATGLVAGVQQMYGNTPVLSPKHFISGLANAGVDLVTARVAGGVLGALGGLTPEAQRKVQDMGLWSGMIRGVTGSVLGLR